MESLGWRLAYIIKNKGISSYRIATDLNIGKSTISNYLKNMTKPDSSKLDAICSYLGINKQWLLTGEGEIYKSPGDRNVREEAKEKDSITVKELMAAIKRRDEHVEALIRVNKKHADNFAELLRQMKKTDAPKGDTAGCAGVAGGEIEK